ncbi:hypothetical protein JYK14_19040 [Siccirubricoccus sp. KC 17139]|uniref:Type II toxin-antitoxin system Phd/YefM family antitoxin n=1 Tax=Siccirubricoccus soli TaxID=2899147 RepID=A0ABT1DAN2_9PROT|nr:hypothetical protein [Siccirubricoccus soli]MCO6418244.1 hypothetical protein [Siccirubricoccus soli]MCP2684379.1 hypothetical protein [Siccirubricoccus soli]
MTADAPVIAAAEFKATCLELLDRTAAGEWDRLEITKRGKVVALLVPPPAQAEALAGLHGCLRGMAVIPPGLDLTAPAAEGEAPFLAEQGLLHG